MIQIDSEEIVAGGIKINLVSGAVTGNGVVKKLHPQDLLLLSTIFNNNGQPVRLHDLVYVIFGEDALFNTQNILGIYNRLLRFVPELDSRIQVKSGHITYKESE